MRGVSKRGGSRRRGDSKGWGEGEVTGSKGGRDERMGGGGRRGELKAREG